ncbi:hypothetical protein B0H19DRAFT_1158139 [Mycena capillaripes]|nr:hypothetical protein B0H19DRAFT_1158139 [Mycena capillaripes]
MRRPTAPLDGLDVGAPLRPLVCYTDDEIELMAIEVILLCLLPPASLSRGSRSRAQNKVDARKIRRTTTQRSKNCPSSVR